MPSPIAKRFTTQVCPECIFINWYIYLVVFLEFLRSNSARQSNVRFRCLIPLWIPRVSSLASRTRFLNYSARYLVGSGGTLSFDIIILTQSYMYRGRKPRKLQPPRLSSTHSYSSLAGAERSVSRTRGRSASRVSLG